MEFFLANVWIDVEQLGMILLCGSCTRGPWKTGISTRGDFGKDSHHPRFPPLPLLPSSYTHDPRHCLYDIITLQSVGGELFTVVCVLYKLDVFDLVIAISYPFGIHSLMCSSL